MVKKQDDKIKKDLTLIEKLSGKYNLNLKNTTAEELDDILEGVYL